jgi:methylated-DNA-[protein]-cysteine S-methyltransferase
MLSHFFLESPIGTLTLVKTSGVLSGLYTGEGRAEAFGPRTHSGFEDVAEQLEEYFARKRTTFTVPIAPAGTPFQQRVWNELTAIPYGETRSYGQLAAAIGNKSAMRAVGAANGRNPISIIVPCHRVIGSNGTLVGYGGGLERKRFLLDLEGAITKLALESESYPSAPVRVTGHS